ncbi:MAG: hypothetical protein GY769_17735 [bacterium]|nr:hypothetical protein [bacterium]
MHTLSVGSGPGTTYDELLAAVSDETGGLHQHTCVPQVELENFLTNSLVTALQGDTVELVGYETGSLPAGGSAEHTFGINGSAYRAAFLLSWSGGTGQPGDLRLRLFAPNGQEVSGQVTSGASFHRVTFHFPLFLRGTQPTPGPLPFAGDWRVRVERVASGAVPILYRTYLLVDDAALEYDFAIERPVVLTGQAIPLQIEVTEGGRRIAPSSIVVSVDRPREAIGNLLHAVPVTDAQRAAVTAQLGAQELAGSSLMQTYEALFRDPARAAALVPIRNQVPFFDDGSAEHGDAQTGDGVFSALFTDTNVPGEYQFHFTVAGESEFHGAFSRQKTASATVVLRQARATEFDVRILDPIEGQDRFEVVVVPKDEFGNYLGPGYASSIIIELEGAEAVTDEVEDRLDGTYTQVFTTTIPGSVSGSTEIFGTEVEIPAEVFPFAGPATRAAWSLHAGWVDPQGTAANFLDPGFTVNLDRVFPIKPDLAWDLRFGWEGFDGVPGAADLDVWMLLANLKHVFHHGVDYDVFVNGGGGLYLLDPGDAEGGANVGLGAAWELSPDLAFEATANYHSVLTASPDLEFVQLQIGLLFKP